MALSITCPTSSCSVSDLRRLLLVSFGGKFKGTFQMSWAYSPTVRSESGHDAVATIRLSSELRESVDAWAAKSDKPARPEAILRLVELGLGTTYRRESAPNRAGKASEMAAQEIDRISDPSATEEERQLRKRRLIKGPREFRDIHKKSREDR